MTPEEEDYLVEQFTNQKFKHSVLPFRVARSKFVLMRKCCRFTILCNRSTLLRFVGELAVHLTCNTEPISVMEVCA